MAKARPQWVKEKVKGNGLLQPPPIEPTRPATAFQRWVPPLSVFLAAIAVYIPALDNEFVSWDDDHYIYDNIQLVHEKGFADLWTNVKYTRYKDVKDPKNRKVLKDSTHQYYPLLFTMFWIEHRIYGDDASVFKPEMEARGYHRTSMVLHAANSVLLILLLHRLGVGVWAAWLVAALFAVHPMNVASVAWAAERKNLLALFFYVLAMMSYLRFRRKGGWSFYAGTFVLFQCALWSKTVALTFPLVLMMTDRLIDRRWDMRNVLRVAPMFVLSIIAGMTTSYVEDRARKVPLLHDQRPFVVAAAAWFYPVKLLLPVNQLPIYYLWNPHPMQPERWHPETDPKWWVPLIGLAVAAWALFHWRRKITAHLGPHFWWGLGLYLITQFPMLGVKNINIFQFAFVQDHYIYNGCAGVFLMMALVVDALRRKLAAVRLGPPLLTALTCAALALYGLKTYLYADVWQNAERFWTTTLDGNPGCWAGWYNLGNQYKRESDDQARKGDDQKAEECIDKAIRHYQSAIEAKPDLHQAYTRVSELLWRMKRKAELERYCDQEIADSPHISSPYYFKGLLRESEQKWAEAVDLFRKALETRRLDEDLADDAGVRAGTCMMKLQKYKEAVPFFELAAKRRPRKYEVRMNLGMCYLKEGQLDKAEAQFQEALNLRANDPKAQGYLDDVRRRKQQ